jgi:hypothetical protein
VRGHGFEETTACGVGDCTRTPKACGLHDARDFAFFDFSSATSLALKSSAGNKACYQGESPDVDVYLSRPNRNQQQRKTSRHNFPKAKALPLTCRLCKGDHSSFTAKCPYKDSLAGLEQVTGKLRRSLSFLIIQ